MSEMSRREAIDYNKNLKMYMKISDKQNPCKFLEENYIALDMAIEALEQKPQWIPCSERLPEEDDVKNVLVSVNKQYALYDVILLPSKSVKTEYKLGHIDAWMPLPEPYKGGDVE